MNNNRQTKNGKPKSNLTPTGRVKKPRRTPAQMRRLLTYRSFSMMLERCLNPKHVSYKEYGGRGIKVYKEWIPRAKDIDSIGNIDCSSKSKIECFEQFLHDVGPRPDKKHTLDRLDANGHYYPDNVRWSTHIDQGSNKRETHYVRHPKTGERIAAAHLARELGLTYQGLRARMVKAGTWYVARFGDADDDEPNTQVKEKTLT